MYRHLALHTSLGRKAANFSFYLGLEQRRDQLKERLIAEMGRTVASGPFSGMLLPEETSWSDGDFIAKLLGFYEEELHPFVLQMIARSPDQVVNVGCAEGYYAIGLARLTSCQVHAIDIDSKALAICTSSARENGVGERVTASSHSLPSNLVDLVRGHRTLIVIDAEGAELDMLPPNSGSDFADCDLIIESHDFRVAGETAELGQRFQATHDLTVITEGARDPNRHKSLTRLSSFDRWLAICEGRPETMSWVVCLSRNRR